MQKAKPKLSFQGILAVGKDLEDATANYRAVAFGQNAKCMIDQKRTLAFVANELTEDITLFNPASGELDLEQDKSLSTSVSFLSESSDAPEDIQVNHHICTAGCGAHMVYDSDDLLKFCPVCATATDATADEADEEEAEDDGEDTDLSADDTSEEDDETAEAGDDDSELSLDDEELGDEDDAAEEDDAEVTDEADEAPADEESTSSSVQSVIPAAIVVAGSSKRIAANLYARIMNEVTTPVLLASGTNRIVTSPACNLNYDPYTAQATLQNAATAADSVSVDVDDPNSAEYQVCASGCGAHVMSSETVKFCPVCAAELEEPTDDLTEDDAEDPSNLGDLDDVTEEGGDAEGNNQDSNDLSVVDAVTDDEGANVDDKSGDEDSPDGPDTEGDDVADDAEACDKSLSADAKSKDKTKESKGKAPAKKAKSPVKLTIKANDGDADEDDKAEGEAVDTEDKSEVAEDAAEDKSEDKSEETTATDLTATPTATESLPETDGIVKETVEVNELDKVETTLSADQQQAKLDVSYSGDVAGKSIWTAYYDGRPVAIATKATAGKNADIFDDAAFGQAVIAGARQNGVKQILTELGFQPLTQTVAVNTKLAARVEAAVATASQQMEDKQKQYHERFMAALSTAAIGINRGFFANISNPVKAGLQSSLSSAGVRNPDVLIDNVFKAQADAYHKALFDKALEILAHSDEAQEEIAKAVLGSNYMTTTASTEDQMTQIGNMGWPRKVVAEDSGTGSSQVATASEDANLMTRINKTVATLGRRRA